MDSNKLEDLRRWAVVAAGDEERIQDLQDAYAAAESYVKGAGVPESGDPLREMLVRKLALYYDECRAPDTRYGYPAPPPDLNALINHLRYAPGGESL